MQSIRSYKSFADRLHVGVIMDGNGRWATRRGLPRLAGHEAGVDAIRRVMEAAPDQGVGTLTLYAFSSDNWRRPEAEVSGLMTLLRRYLRNEAKNLARNDVRLTVIGRRDRLPAGIADEISRKAMPQKTGGEVASRVAEGAAELGLTLIAEIVPIAGARVIGKIPPPYGNDTTYAAGISVTCADRTTATAFIAALTDAAEREVWIAAGFEPPN